MAFAVVPHARHDAGVRVQGYWYGGVPEEFLNELWVDTSPFGGGGLAALALHAVSSPNHFGFPSHPTHRLKLDCAPCSLLVTSRLLYCYRMGT